MERRLSYAEKGKGKAQLDTSGKIKENELTHEEKDCHDHKRRERGEERDQTRIPNRFRGSSHSKDQEPRSSIRQRGEIQSYHQKEPAYDFGYPRDRCRNNLGGRIGERNQRERGLKGMTQKKIDLREWTVVESAARSRRVSQGEEKNLIAAVAGSRKQNACIVQNPPKRGNEPRKGQTLAIEAQKNSSAPPSPPSSLSRNWEHNVFPSFHGPDVRKGFLSHLLEKFKIRGIQSFIDNEIKRGESIGPELIRAIRGSRIALVLLSKRYASSSWCLDELVTIMDCRKASGQIVMTIFYEVDPTHVKKQKGAFGNAFRKTCKGKTKEKIETWTVALEGVATIAGYHSKNWDSDAVMIEQITTDISKMLNHLILSSDFDHRYYIGMGTHIEKMRPLLCLDSDQVRMIGISGPPGIGKSTIARFLFNRLSTNFQLKAHMVKIKECYPRSRLDEYNAQLQLQNQMLSQMFNHKDMVTNHLGVANEMLYDKKVLLVLDDVDRVEQLDALAEDIKWFGRGSRIIIVTEDVRVLRKHGINDIYTVDLPSDDEALQIFCVYAFGKRYPKDGFRELSWEIVCHAGKHPVGLKVLGSCFRNMSKKDWKKALQKVWSSLDGELESILKFCYDALDYAEQNLFLHTCFFIDEERVKECLATKFPCLSQGLDVLAEKSFISFEDGWVGMHELLVKFGREIVRKQSPDEPGKRQFLVDDEEISEILEDDGAGSENVIGIILSDLGSLLNISERAFEGMSNLQFLMIKRRDSSNESLFYLELKSQSLIGRLHRLSYLSSKLRLLHWEDSPIKCLPSNVNMKFLVELYMPNSNLKKLWDRNKRLPNLKWICLTGSENLKELPNLSTATKLQNLALNGCSSLVELPSSIGNATKLQQLNLNGCSSLVELPSSIGNLHQLTNLTMKGCFKLEVLPVNVNLKSLDRLDLRDCSSLKRFPEISTNIRILDLSQTAIEEVPSSIRSWPRLESLDMSHCKKLKKFGHCLDSITERDTKIQDLSPLVKGFPRQIRLILYGCKELLSLSQFPDSLSLLDVRNCESLERLDISFRNPEIDLDFSNCYKLNKETRDLIIQTSPRDVTVVPGERIPTYFSHQAIGGSIIVKLRKRSFPSSLKFKACILLVSNGVEGDDVNVTSMGFKFEIMEKQSGLYVWCNGGERTIAGPLIEHLYIYKLKADVTSNELLFKFTVCKLDALDWMIKKCGIVEENEGDTLDEAEENEVDSSDEEEKNEGDTLVDAEETEVDSSNEEEENEGDSLEEEEENEGDSLEEEEENEGDTESNGDMMRQKRTIEIFPFWEKLNAYRYQNLGTIRRKCRGGYEGSKDNVIEIIDLFVSVGFDEEKVIKAIYEHGEYMEKIEYVLTSERSDVRSKVGTNGDCEAQEEEYEGDSSDEEEENEGDSSDEKGDIDSSDEEGDIEGYSSDEEEEYEDDSLEEEEENEGDSAETKKRKMSDSEAGYSKSKVIKAIREHVSRRTKYGRNSKCDKYIPSEAGINGTCETEEVNRNDTAETKKRKRTSEVGNNGDCEAEGVNGDE